MGRRHQKPWSTAAAQLTRYIDKTMCNRISSLKYRDDHKFEELMRRWSEVARQDFRLHYNILH